ncbi:metallophosphoesterase family protein [Corynebacterium tapiri]|uniref:Nuclease SbcCD subunit D n=1 Tax=Corynebacterium tapiri TaxID=1448266 RepID=A0A5C4U5M9_9CORY|nr:DNA repair exonuclease [Corynebacterium tapiri]TNL99699.1 DNA repair exonuclease [Corynebacterium tapiri]
MHSITFLHTSDLQLGMTRWFLGDDGQALFDDSRLRAIRRIGQLATETDAQFVVIAGDVFDANALSPRVIKRVIDELKRLPVPVYLLPGNHDPLVADSVFRHTGDLDGVIVVDDSEVREVAPGVELVGAPWFSKHPTGDLVRRALEPLGASEKIRIGLAHGQAESRSGEIIAGWFDLAYVEEAMAQRRLDYLALGDTHSAQPVGDSGRVWFSGSPEVTDFAEDSGGGEHNSGQVLQVDITKEPGSDSQVSVTEHRVGEWTFAAPTETIYSDEDIDAFLARLDSYPEKSRTVIKYTLEGTLSLEQTRRLEMGIDARKDVFANLYERESRMDLHVEPTDEEIADLALGGVAASALAELLEDPDDNVATDAAHLLFRLSQEA